MNDDLLPFAVALARDAGAIMRDNFALGMRREWKSDNTPVTDTDLKINDLVVSRIQERFPDHGVLSEERGTVREGAEYVWVCDPVDGTLAFSHGLPTSAFSLALTRQGRSILGVAYDPQMDRLVAAAEGRGATLNGQPVRVSTNDSLAQAVIDIEGASRGQRDLHALAPALRGRGAKVPTIYSMVYSGLLVAAGEFAAVVFGNDTAWDVAALKVIVEEAGGRVTDLYGSDQRYDRPLRGALVSNGHVHDQILALLDAKTTD